MEKQYKGRFSHFLISEKAQDWEESLFTKYNTIFKTLKDLREALLSVDIGTKQCELLRPLEEEIFKLLAKQAKVELYKDETRFPIMNILGNLQAWERMLPYVELAWTSTNKQQEK